MRHSDDLGFFFSISAGYVPSGIAFGALASAVHIAWYFTLLLSLIVYSGAVQSAFVGFWSIGLEPFSMIVTAFLLNLRHTFYGPHLEENYGVSDREYIMTVGPFITDEVYAIGVSKNSPDRSGLRRVAYFSYLCWFSGTVVGIFLTGSIPSALMPVLFLALPSLFLGLMVPRLSGRPGVSAAVISISVSIFFRMIGYPSYYILLAIVSGVLAGMAAEKLSGGGK